MFIRLTHLHIVDRAPVRLGACWDLWVSLQACGEAHQQAGGVCVAQSNERHCWPDEASLSCDHDVSESEGEDKVHSRIEGVAWQ